MLAHRPWTPGRLLLLTLIIAMMIGLILIGTLALVGSSACACDGTPVQTIVPGLQP